MKVFIGKYVKWIGPYQLADTIPFISEDTSEKIGDWLAKTWVNDLCEWLQTKKERKIKVRIDPYDTWSMDNTLAHIILPMLKQLKETKHGSPMVDGDDVPPHMRHSTDSDNYDNWVHYKWEWVLNEMIWAFEQELDDSGEDRFYHGEPRIHWEDIPGTEYSEMKQTNPDYWVDHEGLKEYNARIDNGFRLFGKYYRGLWA
jgi:hypothetical protein